MKTIIPFILRIAVLILILSACTTSSSELLLAETPLSIEDTALAADTPQPPPTEKPTGEPTASPIPPTPTHIPFEFLSPAFSNDGMIPQQYSRRADDISPPLAWGDPPEGTQSFALIVFSDPQPDGQGRWVQWILYNIPSDTREMPEGLVPDVEGYLPDGSKHFPNSWGELSYGGPNPPHVQTFRYYFQLFALDTTLDLEAVEEMMRQEGSLPWIGPSKAIFERAIEGHVLAFGEWVGKYKEP